MMGRVKLDFAAFLQVCIVQTKYLEVLPSVEISFTLP